MSSNNALHFKSLGFSLMMSKLMTSIALCLLLQGPRGKYSKSSNSWTSKIVKNSIIFPFSSEKSSYITSWAIAITSYITWSEIMKTNHITTDLIFANEIRW